MGLTSLAAYYRNRATGKIEGKFAGCDTTSILFRDGTRYDRFDSSEDLALDVPVTPEQVDAPAVRRVKSPDGNIWEISIDNAGTLHVQKLASLAPPL